MSLSQSAKATFPLVPQSLATAKILAAIDESGRQLHKRICLSDRLDSGETSQLMAAKPAGTMVQRLKKQYSKA